jgi:hypothetical protein
MSTKKLNRFILVVPAVLCIMLAGCSTAYMDDKVVASGPVSGPMDVVESFYSSNDVICPAPETADPLPENQLPTTPGQAVQAFYGWYIWYTREMGSPLADGAYRSSKYLTPQFIEKVDGIIISFDKGGYDPFLCAQDIPGKFTIGEMVASGGMASVALNKIWHLGTEYETVSHALIKLRQIDERWLIDDVLCVEWDPLALESEPPKATTPEEKVGEATKNKPPVDGGKIEGWQVFRDDEYGF